MTITNAQLAQDISDFIAQQRAFLEELYAWENGVVGGGTYSNGTYPLTDYAGNSQYYKSPAQMADDVDNEVSSAETHKNDAETAKTAAELAETNAGTSEANALTYRNAAQTAESNASSSASTASNAATNATAAKNVIEGRLTVSASSPSGGSDEDIWFKIVGAGTHEIWVKDTTWKQFV